MRNLKITGFFLLALMMLSTSGTNLTRVQNVYLSLPIQMIYDLGGKWRYKAGVYFAWLVDAAFKCNVSDGYIRKGNSLGEKVIITSADFDFADVQRKFDWGLNAGVDRKLWKYVSLNANLNWGLTPLFPSSFKGMDFKMYNIYATLGVSCKL